MSWLPESEEIKRRRAMAAAQGGEEGIRRQHEKGKLTIRERMHALLDNDSFEEFGPGAGGAHLDEQGAVEKFTPANYVLGFGKIDGRRVTVGGEDFTLKGGSPNAAGLRKSIYAEHLASRYRTPVIRLLEGGGGSVASRDQDPRQPRTVGNPPYEIPRMQILARVLGELPVVSAALGPVAGFPAGRLAASHFSVMTRSTAQVMVAGPALVERAIGEKLSKEELGGAAVHARSGVVDNLAEDEYDAFLQIRRFLGYLPSHVHELAPTGPRRDPADRCEEALLSIVPRDRSQTFSMRDILTAVVDRGSYFEMTREYGAGMITALARLDGQSVGLIANDCQQYGGAMTATGAQKMRRFVEFCDTFHLPVINFIDDPGFMIGPEAEASANIRYGMGAICAAMQARVPWAAVMIRKSYGVAQTAHYAENAYTLAWPSVEAGALPLEGGVAVAYRRVIEASEDPEATRREIEERLAGMRSPYPGAESFAIHELIDPRETRPRLCRWIGWIRPLLPDLRGPVTFPLRP